MCSKFGQPVGSGGGVVVGGIVVVGAGVVLDVGAADVVLSQSTPMK